MQKLSDYQGAYEGERMIEGNNFHLDFRMSIREDNNGDFGIEFKDILSGDIYAFLDGVKRKLPFSFVCETVNYRWAEQKMIFNCRTLPSHSEYDNDLFNNKEILEIIGEFTGEQGVLLFKAISTNVQHKFRVTKNNNKIERSLAINVAIEKSFTNSGILDVLPDVIDKYGDEGVILKAASRFEIIDHAKNEWSAEEINDLLEIQFPEVKDASKWPDWKCYALIISKYKDNENAVGLVFDNRAPGNQGLALFVGHEKMKDAHPHAKNHRIYAWIHEIGHILGLDHSYAGPENWMREQLPEPHVYEVISFGTYHAAILRHIHPALAIPGHRSGMATLLGEKKYSPKTSSLELILKSYGVFHYAEPVELEVRLRNCSKRGRLIAPCLHPEGALLKIQIRNQARGSWFDYQPSLHYIWNGEPLLLESNRHTDDKAATSGKDRFSQWISVSNGFNGVPMFNPGKYVLRACYQYQGKRVWSDEHQIEIRPANAAFKNVLDSKKRRDVKNFLFNHAKKAQKGCQSFIKQLVKKHPEERVRARYTASLAKTTGDSRRVFAKTKNNKLVIKSKAGNLERATALLQEVKSYYERAGVDLAEQKMENLSYRRYVEWNAAYLIELGQANEALALLQELKSNLASRAVKPHALDALV